MQIHSIPPEHRQPLTGKVRERQLSGRLNASFRQRPQLSLVRQAKIMKVHTAIFIVMAWVVLADGAPVIAQPYAPPRVPTPDMAMSWNQKKY